MKAIFVAVLWLAMLPAQAEELYRWVDNTGKVHYGDVPANDAAQLQEKKFDKPAPAAIGDEALPFEVRRAKQRFPVTLYVEDSCTAPCRQGRDFLKQRHIPYAEKRLVTQEEIEEFKQRSGSDVMPTLSVGSIWLKGFLEKSWADELDAAGYPK